MIVILSVGLYDIYIICGIVVILSVGLSDSIELIIVI